MAQSPKTKSGWASRGIQYYVCIIYNFLGFNVHIIIDLVKRGVLTLVSEIRRYRNDYYYYYYYLLSSQVRLPFMKTVQPIRSHLPA